jgi:hypothetical protein
LWTSREAEKTISPTAIKPKNKISFAQKEPFFSCRSFIVFILFYRVPSIGAIVKITIDKTAKTEITVQKILIRLFLF